MADDCRPQQYTHTATVITSLFSRFVGGLVDLLIRFCFCFGLAVLLLGPWNVQYVVVFVPAWMIPPMYHSLCRESVKSTDSGSVTGVKSIRPTLFQDTTATRGPPPSSVQGTRTHAWPSAHDQRGSTDHQ